MWSYLINLKESENNGCDEYTHYIFYFILLIIFFTLHILEGLSYLPDKGSFNNLHIMYPYRIFVRSDLTGYFNNS